MICPHCGAEVEPAPFDCPKCGWRLFSPDPTQMRVYTADGREYGPHLPEDKQGIRRMEFRQAGRKHDRRSVRRDESRKKRLWNRLRPYLKVVVPLLAAALIWFVVAVVTR